MTLIYLNQSTKTTLHFEAFWTLVHLITAHMLCVIFAAISGSGGLSALSVFLLTGGDSLYQPFISAVNQNILLSAKVQIKCFHNSFPEQLFCAHDKMPLWLIWVAIILQAMGDFSALSFPLEAAQDKKKNNILAQYKVLHHLTFPMLTSAPVSYKK